MTEIFKKSYSEYKNFMEQTAPNYWELFGYQTRRTQCESLIDAINDRFNFNTILTVETGVSQNVEDAAFGVFLGFITEKTNGEMYGVDIDEERIKKSEKLFSSVIPDLYYRTYKEDSVSFLKNIEVVPNLVHLDSWDLDLKNPLPSMLHGWMEFKAIESIMPKGSIIIIDDNYIGGTWVEWIYPDDRPKEIITITYPMIGKGALVYHHVLNGKSGWELIGSHYGTHGNIKVIIQKT